MKPYKSKHSIENQSQIHYGMAARCMEYDSRDYGMQMEEIPRKKRRGGRRPGRSRWEIPLGNG